MPKHGYVHHRGPHDDCAIYGAHHHIHDGRTRHVDQHDCAANHCDDSQFVEHEHDPAHNGDHFDGCGHDDELNLVDGIRSDDQHDAEHNLDRAIAQYLNDRRNPGLTDTDYRGLVNSLYLASFTVIRHLAGDR